MIFVTANQTPIRTDPNRHMLLIAGLCRQALDFYPFSGVGGRHKIHPKYQ